MTMKFVIFHEKNDVKNALCETLAKIANMPTTSSLMANQVNFSEIETDKYCLWHGKEFEKSTFIKSDIENTEVLAVKHREGVDAKAFISELITLFPDQSIYAVLCLDAGKNQEIGDELLKLNKESDAENLGGVFSLPDANDPGDIYQLAESIRNIKTRLQNTMKILSQAKTLGIVHSNDPDSIMIYYNKKREPVPEDVPNEVAASVILREDQGLASLIREWITFPLEFDLPMDLRTDGEETKNEVD